MKKQNSIKSKNLVVIFANVFLFLLLIGNISALDKSLGLSTSQITDLEAIGIKDIKLIEYPCQEGIKCYAIDGDVQDKLVSIPLRVKDNCIQKVTDQPVTKVINKKAVIIIVKRRDCSGVYNYRDITQGEIDTIIQDTLNKKLSDKIKTTESYYPIPDDTNVQSKSITIGSSVDSWIEKIIKGIGDAIGL